MTRLFVLLGDPVAHSLSPRIQNHALARAGLDARYIALQTPAVAVEGLVRGIALVGGGGNVTLPHKRLAWSSVDRHTPAAQRTGAVNTFWAENGEVWGDNTDVHGLRMALRRLAGDRDHAWAGATVLLLGAGGAARAALLALEEEGIGQVILRSRRPEVAHELTRELQPAVGMLEVEGWAAGVPSGIDLILNATPLGLRPEDAGPVPADAVEPTTRVMDLVYRPEHTRWVRALKERGVQATDGGDMLLGQGAAAFTRWWGHPPPEGAFEEALAEIRHEAGAR